MRLRPALAPLLTAALVGSVALVATPTATAAPDTRRPSPKYQEYVALGDSWSADVVIASTDGLPDRTHVPTGCAQSHRNYPKLLAKALKVPVFRDATCGSATTDDFYAPQTGLPTGESNSPQFNRLTRTTDLVTVGIGGNDAGFAGAAMSCLNPAPFDIPLSLTLPFGSIPLFGNQVPTGGCKKHFTAGGVDQLAQQIDASLPKLVKALRDIHRISPKARVLMVNYLDAIPATGCYPVVPMSNEDMGYLNQTFAHLNAMVRTAARQGRAELVDSYGQSAGHDVCTPPHVRWVEGLGVVSVNGLAVAVPAHPNSAGAAAQFRSVLPVALSPRPHLKKHKVCPQKGKNKAGAKKAGKRAKCHAKPKRGKHHAKKHHAKKRHGAKHHRPRR